MDIYEKVGRFFLYKCRLIVIIEKFSLEKEYLNTINPRDSNEEILPKLWGKRIFTIILLILLICAFNFVRNSLETDEKILENNYLIRQEEESDINVKVSVKKEDEEWSKKLKLNIKERELNDNEKKKLESEVKDYLEKVVLGKNTDFQNIKEDLVLPDKIPDTEIILTWIYDGDYISEEGKIKNYGLKKNIETEIIAQAEYKNWKHNFTFKLNIRGKEYNEEQMIINSIKTEIKKKLKQDSTKEKVDLPENFEGFKVSYSEIEKNKNNHDLIIFTVMLIMLPFLWREKTKKAIKKRDQQMLLDYPEIISKIMLLLGAGLSFRMTIERITGDYERRRKKGGRKRFVYEELCILLQEMKDGISEHIAIEKFGKRCRLVPYLRFSSLMSQNMKKGAEGIIEILEKESMDALIERKNKVLQLGEIAGTKLLVPMVIMLVLVISLIMIPAFMSI